MAGNLNERTNKNASDAGQAFEHDPVIKQLKQTTNGLSRAKSIMNGQTPVTSKTFALLQQDLISAMAPGGAATEGKVNREMVHTLNDAINDIQLKFGSVNDLRKEQPQIFQQLKELVDTVQKDYQKATSAQAGNIAESYRYSNNPKVQKTVADKLKSYSYTEPGGLLNEAQATDKRTAPPVDIDKMSREELIRFNRGQ